MATDTAQGLPAAASRPGTMLAEKDGPIGWITFDNPARRNGGGVSVAMSCDMRIAAAGARFGVPAARLGLGYEFKGVRKLVDVVGPSFAKEIFFTARQFTAEEALAMGLINRLLPETDLEGFVRGYAQTIADNAPMTVASIKTIVEEVLKDESQRDMALCQDVVDRCFNSADYIEGRTAFMEKRKPVFTGS